MTSASLVKSCLIASVSVTYSFAELPFWKYLDNTQRREIDIVSDDLSRISFINCITFVCSCDPYTPSGLYPHFFISSFEIVRAMIISSSLPTHFPLRCSFISDSFVDTVDIRDGIFTCERSNFSESQNSFLIRSPCSASHLDP